MGFKVLGMQDLQREADRVTRDLAAQERPAEMAAAEPILRAWQGLVPVEEGHYRDSLGIAWLGPKGAAVGTRWVQGLPREEQPVLYAKRLEFGDSDLPAHPSARPALDASRRQVMEAAEDAYRPVVKGRRPRKRRPTT